MRAFALGLTVSFLLHASVLWSAQRLQTPERAKPSQVVQMKVVPKPPPPPPKVEPEPPKPKPKPKKRKKKAVRAPIRKDETVKPEAPKPSAEPPPKPSAPPPMGFSVDMSSTVVGGGVAVVAMDGGGNMFANPNERDLAPGKKTNVRPPPASGDGKGPGRGDPVTLPPRFLTSEADRTPPYPKEAREAGIEGRVILRAYIGTDGRVQKIRVTKRLGLGCDEVAVRYARQRWRFEPATVGGAPIGMWITVPVTFVLER